VDFETPVTVNAVGGERKSFTVDFSVADLGDFHNVDVTETITQIFAVGPFASVFEVVVFNTGPHVVGSGTETGVTGAFTFGFETASTLISTDGERETLASGVGRTFGLGLFEGKVETTTEGIHVAAMLPLFVEGLDPVAGESGLGNS